VNQRASKKQLILAYAKTRGLRYAERADLLAIGRELERDGRVEGKTSFTYIAHTLRQAGVRVEYEDRYIDPWMEEPYATRLCGLLQFRDLESAEASLQRLDAIYREYRSNADRVGTTLVRALVTKGRQRAESLAANPRVNPEKRREKAEIALWFRVWLEVPDLFFDWLELRQQSREYQQQFASRNASNQKDRAVSPAA